MKLLLVQKVWECPGLCGYWENAKSCIWRWSNTPAAVCVWHKTALQWQYDELKLKNPEYCTTEMCHFKRPILFPVKWICSRVVPFSESTLFYKDESNHMKAHYRGLHGNGHWLLPPPLSSTSQMLCGYGYGLGSANHCEGGGTCVQGLPGRVTLGKMI